MLHALQWTLIILDFLSFGLLFQALKIVRFEYCSFTLPPPTLGFRAVHSLFEINSPFYLMVDA